MRTLWLYECQMKQSSAIHTIWYLLRIWHGLGCIQGTRYPDLLVGWMLLVSGPVQMVFYPSDSRLLKQFLYPKTAATFIGLLVPRVPSFCTGSQHQWNELKIVETAKSSTKLIRTRLHPITVCLVQNHGVGRYFVIDLLKIWSDHFVSLRNS